MDFNRQESNEIKICEAETLANFGELDHNNIKHGNIANFIKQNIDTEMIAKTKGIKCRGINLAKIKMLTDKEIESEAQRDDSTKSESEVKRMPDFYSSAAIFIKNIESKVEGDIDDMIDKKKKKKERKNKINRARFTVFDIFDFLDFKEEDDDKKPK